MYFRIPDSESLTMLALNKKVPNNDEIRAMAIANDLSSFVKDMVVEIIVSSDYCEEIYNLLNTGQCTFGLHTTPVYRVTRPIQVNDCEGKKRYKLIAKLVHVEDDDQLVIGNKVDTKA